MSLNHLYLREFPTFTSDNPRTNIRRIQDYIDSSHVNLVLSIDKAIPKIEQIKNNGFKGSIICVSAKDSLSRFSRMFYTLKNPTPKHPIISWNDFLMKGDEVKFKRASYRRDRVAVIVYTGGTTGTPKAAMLTNDTMNIIAHQYRYLGADYNRTQNFLNIMPPFIAYGITCGIHMPLTLGLNDVLIPLFDPNKFDDLMIKYKPSHFLGVPSHYDSLSKSEKMRDFDLSFLESAGAGGDAISIEIEKKINDFLKLHGSKYSIAKGYGMTEVGSAAVASHGNINKLGSAGIPHCNTTVSVFEPNSERELNYYEVGEICISTPAMMLGYLNDEEATKEVLREHNDGNVWVHSNDLGYMDEDGFVFINGRMKRMIIRPDGHNVFPALIENTIDTHYAVEKCAVVGKADKDSSRGEYPVAYIVLKKEFKREKGRLTDIEEYCSERIPPRDTAVEFFEIDELPLTEIGKIDYRALEALAGAASPQHIN